MSKHSQLPVEMIIEFQKRYFAAFPGIQKWHRWVAQQLIKEGQLTTMLGRRRQFLGRLYEDSTIREAVAHEPQSITADTIDEGLLAIWRRYPEVQLLLQVHDSILLQYPEHLEDTLLPQLLSQIEIKRELLHGRTFTIPAEAKIGWNWGDVAFWGKEDFAQGRCSEDQIGKIKDNPDGLAKWKGKSDARRRQKEVPVVSIRFRGRDAELSFTRDPAEVDCDSDSSGSTGAEGLD